MRTANLRHDPAFDALDQTIRETTALFGTELIFVPSPGNWGDALINEGSRQFFRHRGHSVREVRRAEVLELAAVRDLRTSTVIVGGGGGWCHNFPTTRAFVDELRRHVGAIIILPTTYELPLLDPQGTGVRYFTREQSLTRDDVDFCHDMAFYIDAGVDVFTADRLWRLFAMRLDQERNPESFVPDRNVDLSALGNSYSTVHQFFELVSRFDVVYTDRLHVAIASCMTGRRVHILPGNYGKSAGVFAASLESNYSNVSMMTWAAMKDLLSPS